MKTTWLLICLLLPVPGWAAELRIPEQFDVLVVNGKEHSSSLSRNKVLTLPAGRNTVIIEFDQIFDADFGDSHDRIRSAPFALIFSVEAADQLQLTGPRLTNGSDARRYASAPTVQLNNASNQPVNLQQLPVTELGGLLLPANGVPPGAATNIAVTAATTATAPEAPQSTSKQPAPDALQMLNYWWQQATPAQRAAFLQAITR